MTEITKQDVINDIVESNRKYQVQYETSKFISRDAYRSLGTFSYEKISLLFGAWSKASEEAQKLYMAEIKSPVEDMERLNYEKKILSLENDISNLKREKKLLLFEKIDEEKLTLVYENTIMPQKLTAKIKTTKVKENKDIEAILMLSDLHASEMVKGDEIENVNEYNLEIMIKRLNRIFDYFLFYCKNNKVTKANILFLGDLFTGDIHDELIRTNELNVVETQFLLLDYFINKLTDIEKYFSNINIEIIVGNHGRFKMGKPEYKTAAILNWEYLFAENLRRSIEYLKMNNKIKINVNRSLFKVITIADRKFLILHGHVLSGAGSGGFAGIPYYGLAMSSAKFFGIMEQHSINVTREIPFQDILMGHLHSTTKIGLFNGNLLYINGCVIGVNEYSLFKVRGVSKVEQTMLLVSEGKVVGEYTLWG